jgi:hypothetical protein
MEVEVEMVVEIEIGWDGPKARPLSDPRNILRPKLQVGSPGALRCHLMRNLSNSCQSDAPVAVDDCWENCKLTGYMY